MPRALIHSIKPMFERDTEVTIALRSQSPVWWDSFANRSFVKHVQANRRGFRLTAMLAIEAPVVKPKRPRKLSQGEFRLMGLLWQKGPLTLAEVHDLQPGQLAYTTIQTQLNRLVGKRFATRTRKRPMKYRALVGPLEAGDSMLQVLIDSVGGGSVIPLVIQLVGRASLSPADARVLKRAVDGAIVTPRKPRSSANRRPRG